MKAFFKKSLLLVGQFMFRYGLGIILLWSGILKFTGDENIHLEQAISRTLVFEWLLRYITFNTFSIVFAGLEIFAGFMIMLKPISAKFSVLGGTLAMVVSLAGIIAFTTSGIAWQPDQVFPQLLGAGHYFIKDLVLFGAAAWCTSDSI